MEALANVQLALAIIYNEKLVCYSPSMVPVASYCFSYIIKMTFLLPSSLTAIFLTKQFGLPWNV